MNNLLKIQSKIIFITFLALLHQINHNLKIFSKRLENIQKYKVKELYQEK